MPEFTLERIPTLIANFLAALPVPFWIVLAVILLLLLFIGMFMETVAASSCWHRFWCRWSCRWGWTRCISAS
ncbi:TRAP transporter large permease subunit [Billgrantia gudaonensis]|uniref:TRAP transporter large permease subunit n=1 Tax=Billgrantia gudaonensis TaxID=376427 RepID=A0A432JJ82_9GAMM|nr:TRAP transporter large permease subunit [Halomonas gudaonensis]